MLTEKNWVLIDETTNAKQCFIANVKIRTLTVSRPGSILLLNWNELKTKTIWLFLSFFFKRMLF